MSMEVFVLSDRRVSSITAWQQSIDLERLDLTLPSDANIDGLRGFLPVTSRTGKSGFECDHREATEVMKLYSNISFGRNWRQALAFNWQGLDEGVAAYQAAAAYAGATDGIVFDPQESLVMLPQEAFAAAARFKADIPTMKAAIQAALARLRQP